jgi:hypothetical protein
MDKTAYLSPKLEVRYHPAHGEWAVFARQPLQPGELVSVWSGFIVSAARLASLPTEMQKHTLQVEEDAYLVTSVPDEPADYINHSCSPNVGLNGQIVLVAMRDIEPGEEICFDYAMSDGSPYDEFDCACGASNCRGRVTGDDWRRTELWERYAGYFSPYLQRRIEALRTQAALLDATIFDERPLGEFDEIE